MSTHIENMYKAVFDQHPVAMCILDEDFSILVSNRIFQELEGRGLEVTADNKCGLGLGCLHENTIPDGVTVKSSCDFCSLFKAMQKAKDKNIETKADLVNQFHEDSEVKIIYFHFRIKPIEISGKSCFLLTADTRASSTI